MLLQELKHILKVDYRCNSPKKKEKEKQFRANVQCTVGIMGE